MRKWVLLKLLAVGNPQIQKGALFRYDTPPNAIPLWRALPPANRRYLEGIWKINFPVAPRDIWRGKAGSAGSVATHEGKLDILKAWSTLHVKLQAS